MSPHSKDPEMKRHIENWQTSGQSQVSYCKQHQIPVHQFIYYKQKLGYRSGKPAPTVTNQLVPVSLTTEITNPSSIRVHHENGFGVTIEPDVDSRHLHTILSVIREIS